MKTKAEKNENKAHARKVHTQLAMRFTHCLTVYHRMRQKVLKHDTVYA